MTDPRLPRRPRERVVLARRRGSRMVHTRVEVAEQTGVGDALVRGLVRAQLGLAVRMALLVAGTMTAVALLTGALPGFGAATVAGIRVNWLILGVAVYPAMYAAGRVFVALAEQNERHFIGVIEQGDEQ